MKSFPMAEKKQKFTSSLIDANDQLYYFALQLTENKDDAKDLVQETNFKALKNYKKLKTDEHKNAWLYTILKNTHINNLRSSYYRSIKNNNIDNELYLMKARNTITNDPDKILQNKELKEKIRCLPESFSKPLKLLLAGYSYKEIAKMTDVPIGTVKSRIYIAKQKLRMLYGNA